jgi:hypothetical protein
MRDRVKATAFACAATGAVVASLPWFVLGIIVTPDEASTNGHITVHNGWKTWWGWVEFGTFVGQIAAIGAAAGVLFWLIAAARAGAPNNEAV